jgi:hypothetical protein
MANRERVQRKGVSDGVKFCQLLIRAGEKVSRRKGEPEKKVSQRKGEPE